MDLITLALAKKYTEKQINEIPSGEKGDKGDTGKNIEYTWNGTSLGVRIEGESEYQYVNLKGDTGEKGDTGNGIASVTLKSGDHSPGTTDVYTITFIDGTSTDFSVYNGANGELLIEDIVDDLTTGGSDKVLSAEQGKVLGTQISQLSAQAGDAPLTTTAQTLSGAVNEVDAAVDTNTASISQLTDNGAITATVVLTQTEYDALVTPDPTTIYIVVGA